MRTVRTIGLSDRAPSIGLFGLKWIERIKFSHVQICIKDDLISPNLGDDLIFPNPPQTEHALTWILFLQYSIANPNV